MAKPTKTGVFGYPEPGDCAACTFGTDHRGKCVGVEWNGERIYDHRWDWLIESQKAMIKEIYG